MFRGLTVKELKEWMDDGNVPSNYTLFWSCYDDNFEIVKYLLSDEILEKFPDLDPSIDNSKYIYFTCSNGNIDMLKLLLSERITKRFPKIDPSAYGTKITPACVNGNMSLDWACMKGHFEIVKYLLSDEILERFPKINPTSDYNCLTAACFSLDRNADIVNFLLSDRIIKRFPKIISELKERNNQTLKVICNRQYLDILECILPCYGLDEIDVLRGVKQNELVIQRIKELEANKRKIIKLY